ncbi:MAG: PQQ-dependent sugar dehydrogenase [Sphingorhabdus sp.]
MSISRFRLVLAASAAVAVALPSVPSLAQAPTAIVDSRAGKLAVEQLVALDEPWGIAQLPDGALLITEKPGRLRIWRDGMLSPPVAGVPAVAYRGQGGLLDIELDPDFASNSIVYLSYVELGVRARPGGKDTSDPRLGVYQEVDDADTKGLAVARARFMGTALEGLRVIWRAEKTVGRGHFGGRLAFAPDGALLLTAGERQRFEPAQDRQSRLGKIVRIRTDGTPAAGNPFASEQGAAREIWSYGHRNPLGIAVRPGTNEIWLSEMGPQGGDEINQAAKGRDYGWPIVSAGDNYDGTLLSRPSTRPTLGRALHEFNPAISPASLMFYTGTMFPAWRGQMLIGGLSSKALVRGNPGVDGVHDVEAIQIGFRVRDVAQDRDGSLLILKDGKDGGLMRATPSASPAPTR